MVAEKIEYGNFGPLSDAYEQTRLEYPQEIISQLRLFLLRRGPVVDLGCGTGISTRQIARVVGRVIGVDYDKMMLVKAVTHPLINVSYVQARAERLPFRSASLSGVASFGAFHWFCNTQVLEEIKRVLMPGGFLDIVNRSDEGVMRWDYLTILEEVSEKKLANIREGYSPRKAVEDAGFNNISEFHIPVTYEYSLQQLLLLFQSMSHWDLVLEELKPRALARLEEHFTPLMAEGIFKRDMDVQALVGFKR